MLTLTQKDSIVLNYAKFTFILKRTEHSALQKGNCYEDCCGPAEYPMPHNLEVKAVHGISVIQVQIKIENRISQILQHQYIISPVLTPKKLYI